MYIICNRNVGCVHHFAFNYKSTHANYLPSMSIYIYIYVYVNKETALLTEEQTESKPSHLLNVNIWAKVTHVMYENTKVGIYVKSPPEYWNKKRILKSIIICIVII